MGQEIFTSEAAKALGIGVSTLRNYALLLESKGYGFERGMNNGRIFRANDLELLKKMVERIGDEGTTVEQAAEATVEEAKEKGKLITPIKEKSRFDGFEQLCEKMSQLEKQQVQLIDMNQTLAHQVERLTEKIEERERNQELLERLERSQQKRKRRGLAFLSPLLSFNGKKP